MKLKKGIVRIIILSLWFLLCIKFVFLMMPLFDLSSTKHILGLFTLFAIGFYTPAVITAGVNAAYSPKEQIFDPASTISRTLAVISAITGSIGLGIYAHKVSFESIRHIRGYMIAFVIPAVAVFGSYVFVCWIVKGFRDVRQ